jgi:hypothetical protein
MSKRRLHVPWRKPLANPISQCIDSEQWDQVIGLAQSKPELVKHWTERSGFFEGIRPANVLPIHEACANESVPVAAIEALIQAYPESIKVDESAYHRLPLHIACRKTANISVVRYLLEGYANACLEPDALGRLPIHYAISNGANDEVVSLLLKYNPNAARGVDGKGWTPLHVACNIGASTRICTELLELYPEASVLCTYKGTSALQCLRSQFAANKPEVAALLQRYQEKVKAESPRHAKQATDLTHHVIV